MGGKHLLLLLKHTRYLFLESEVLLLVVPPHRPFHSVHIVFNLPLVLLHHHVLQLDLLLNLLGLLRKRFLIHTLSFLHRIRTILIPPGLLCHQCLFDWYGLSVFGYFSGGLSWNWRVVLFVTLHRIKFGRHLILRILWL
jgi:hypothetical protein